MIDSLQGALQSCSLHSLLMLTSKALTRSGFGDVEILDRRHSKQKSRSGGHELSCHTTIGILPAKVVVKVINDEVRIRMLDELAGAVDRTHADLGLIVTTKRLCKSARKMLASYRRSRISAIEGPELATLLLKHGIAARGADVDYAFLSSLEEVSEKLLSFIAENRV